MKNLLVMRHAKSDWGNSSISDFDRPLNIRGAKTAPIMGKELLERNKIPDLIISSPANRAKSTTEITSNFFDYKGKIVYEQEFYFGSIEQIIRIIKNCDNQNQIVMAVGHNPTWETLVHRLIRGKESIQMPTAAIASIVFEIEAWDQIEPKTGRLEWLIIPKELKA